MLATITTLIIIIIIIMAIIIMVTYEGDFAARIKNKLDEAKVRENE